MNRYIKEFLHRGLLFGGFGPIVIGIVYYILEQSVPDFSLSGPQVCLAIVSTYVLAFLQAGASVFHQIEAWAIPKALLCHFSVLYAAYVLCYLVNAWIPFEPLVLLIFTATFVIGYLLICVIVYLSTRIISRRLNEKLR